MNVKMNRRDKLTWNQEHQKRYDMLFNKFKKTNPNAVKDTYILDNVNPKSKNGLLAFVKNSNYGLGTQKYLLFMIARYLEMRDDPNHIPYNKEAKIMRSEIEEAEDNNFQTAKENEHYRDHAYFVQLINEAKEHDYTLLTFKEHMNFLILCLLVLQPPVRTNYYISAKYMSQQVQNNEVDNFIFINAKLKKIYYIINNDKVSTSLYYKLKPALSKIEITDPFLKELLFYSFKKYPREYLLQKNHQDDEPITQPTYLRWLRTATGIEGIDNDIMRSSYVTWYYNDVATNHKHKLALSHQMRHSITSASKYYYKDIKPEDLTQNEQDESVAENPKSKTVNIKKFAKQRYDVLYRLNNGTSKPRPITVMKYNIKLKDGIYI